MKIALTGGSGSIGSAVIELALARGDSVRSIDRIAPKDKLDGVDYVMAEMSDYDRLRELFAGYDAVIHMAAIPWAFRDPDHLVHNNNVTGSYNVMHAAISCGITRICQASSVNAVGLSYSREGRFDYFPIDEQHPNYTEEPYGLSKWICEQQADTFVRRHSDLSIASLRFHWVVPERAIAANSFNTPSQETAKHLWGYALREPAAQACLLAVDGKFTGHEVFYIAAPVTSNDIPSVELASRYYPDVPIRGPLDGNTGFFNCAKADRILGWRHDKPLPYAPGRAVDPATPEPSQH